MKNKLSQSITWADLRILLATLVIIAAFFIKVGYLEKGQETLERGQKTNTDDIKDINTSLGQMAIDLTALTTKYNASENETYRRRTAGEVTKATSSAIIVQRIELEKQEKPAEKKPEPTPTPTPPVTQSIFDILGFLGH